MSGRRATGRSAGKPPIVNAISNSSYASQAPNSSSPALMTNQNSPSVISVIGSENSLMIGLMKPLTTPNTSASRIRPTMSPP